MNVYRPKYKDRQTGQMRETPRWYLDLTDHHGKRQRFAGDEDKHATRELGRKLEDLVHCRKRGVLPKDRLWNWLMGLPLDMQQKLVKLDLAEQAWFCDLRESERLQNWIDDFENWLMTSRSKSGYRRRPRDVGLTMGRIRAITEGCGFKTWADIKLRKVQSYLGSRDVALSTHNNYITAFKHFCTWCVRDGRAEFSPVQYLERVRIPQKETRRPLDTAEVDRLIQTTVTLNKRYKMTGLERAVLYRLAIETGFRANELRHLTVDCFDLDKARVRLAAPFCKDRRDALQPITMALAARLKGFLKGRDAEAPAFGLPSRS